MANSKQDSGKGSGGPEKSALTSLPGGPKTKRKRTYSKVARLQINRRFQQLERTNQLRLPTRKARQTIEETRKPISKLIRMKRNPKNRDQVVRATLTSEGKLMRVLFRGASKQWENMDALRKERYRRMVTETLVKQTQAVSRRKGNERKTVRQVRVNILPELERSQRRLGDAIEASVNTDSSERTRELGNMRSVVAGMIAELKQQNIPRERALTAFRPDGRIIPYLGEEAIQRMKSGISPALEEEMRRRKTLRKIPGETRWEHPHLMSRLLAEPDGDLAYSLMMDGELTPEEAAEIAHRALRPGDARIMPFLRSGRSNQPQNNRKKIAPAPAIKITEEGGRPRLLPERSPALHQGDPQHYARLFHISNPILPYSKYTPERKSERRRTFAEKQPGASFVRGYPAYGKWLNVVSGWRAAKRNVQKRIRNRMKK